MQLLELLYQKEFKNIPAIPRKLSIAKEDKIILCGPRGSGKSYLIYDYLQFESYGSYLYIDFFDLRVEKIDPKVLEKFCEEKKITTLVLENFDFSFEPPDVLKTIITTTSFVKKDGFVTKILYPLDFEEFISFEKKITNEQSAFNSFSTKGTYPFIVTSKKDNFEKNFQTMLRSIFFDQTEFFILKKLALKQSHQVTLLGIFHEIKKEIKISKDKFYEIVKKLKDEMIIFLIPKYKKNSHKKKLYLIDFTIKNVLSFDKDFKKRFENIIFLELLKRNEEIYYSDRVEFILPKKSLAITPMLFLPEGLMKNKIDLLLPTLKELDIKNLWVITLEAEFSFKKDGINCEAMPFWSFALGG